MGAILIDSSRNVVIRHCDIACEDDCIALKSGLGADGLRVNRPTENVVIEDCRFGIGHAAISFGSDLSGGIRNVTVRNCNIEGTSTGIRFKPRKGIGGFNENIFCSGIRAAQVEQLFVIDMAAFEEKWRAYVPEHLGRRIEGERALTRIRNLIFQDIEGTAITYGIYTNMDPNSLPINVTFHNVSIQAETPVHAENNIFLDASGVKYG